MTSARKGTYHCTILKDHGRITNGRSRKERGYIQKHKRLSSSCSKRESCSLLTYHPWLPKDPSALLHVRMIQVELSDRYMGRHHAFLLASSQERRGCQQGKGSATIRLYRSSCWARYVTAFEIHRTLPNIFWSTRKPLDQIQYAWTVRWFPRWSRNIRARLNGFFRTASFLEYHRVVRFGTTFVEFGPSSK